MRQFITACLLLLFAAGLATNTYLRYEDKLDVKISVIEEEEETKGKTYELKECIITEFSSNNTEICLLLASKSKFYVADIDYEDVFLTCLETPPDHSK